MALPPSIKQEQFQIKITHIPTGQTISFDSWLTGFTDAFSSTWAPTAVYGRMDDLLTFAKTSRVITIGFDVVAAEQLEAEQNQFRLNKLAQFLYPVYSNSIAPATEASPNGPDVPRARANSRVLKAAPLLKMKFNSLVSNPAAAGGELVGYLNGFTYAPNILDGQFFANKTTSRDMVYQSHNVQLTYNVLHTHLTGWVERSTGTTTEGVTVYSFASGISEDFNLDFPHRGAREGDMVVRPIDNNFDGTADVWQTGIGTTEEEAQADQDQLLT
tara:strand:- start:1416 stop:2231 length:816 start_codon:yes stop_codon:yes gene_type:complete